MKKKGNLNAIPQGRLVRTRCLNEFFHVCKRLSVYVRNKYIQSFKYVYTYIDEKKKKISKI